VCYACGAWYTVEGRNKEALDGGAVDELLVGLREIEVADKRSN
jgi:hypothetical protein